MISWPSDYEQVGIRTCHGLEPGSTPPSMVYAYVEITPYDFVKYTVDKATGHLLAGSSPLYAAAAIVAYDGVCGKPQARSD